jgi:site-specific recombinase XerC
LEFYRGYLNLSKPVIGIGVTGQEIKQFIDTRQCGSGGKHAYYRALRTFYNWLYSPKSGYGLNPQHNPILIVDPPKVGKRILPSLTPEQIVSLIDKCESVRDKAVISLFSDSGLRLSE